jgi:hypothetical protein
MAALSEVELISPDIVRALAQAAFAAARTCTLTDSTAFARRVAVAGVAMRYDLRGTPIPSREQMERIAANVPVPHAKSDGPAG